MEPDYVRRWRQKGKTGYVSSLYHCLTENATDLCLYDIRSKLETNSRYDIGGTYSHKDPEFWFYYTTSVCHGYNHLLNLFVLPRKPSNFSIIVPRPNKLSQQIKTEDNNNIIITYGPQTQLSFKTFRKDEHIFITTLRFETSDLTSMKNCTMLVPILIEKHTKLQLDQNIVRTIKLRHDLSSLMLQKETKDFTLVSLSGKQYPVHKVLVAAHSPILRLKLHSSEQSLALDVTEEAMEIIIEFLYTGSISNIHEYDFTMLLGIAEGLQFKQLFTLTQHFLGEMINVNNAVSIAIIAKKYKLEGLTMKVFDFIKVDPEVMSTDDWNALEDIDLVKQLMKYIHPSVQNVN